MISISKVNIHLVTTIILFILLFPLISQINFFQNDDWVYYKMVQNIIAGNFTLHPYISPTFYTQGFMGAFFARLFSIEKLPVLTLLISVLNFYVLIKIFVRLKKSNTEALFLGLVYFFNPLNIYLTLGFMTELYFMFFFLLSIYSYIVYEQTNSKKQLLLSYIFAFIGLNVRQVALIIPLGIFLHNFIKKQYKEATTGLASFSTFYLYYAFVFPKTSRMLELPLQYSNLLNFEYSYALTYGVFILLFAFLMPVMFLAIDFKRIYESKSRLVVFILLFVVLFFVFNTLYNPQKVYLAEFPYFQNTFERAGFYPRGVAGTKYLFKGNFDLYRFWDLVAKLLVSGFISFLIIFKRRKINFYAFLFGSYLFVLLVTQTFYDRYIIVLVPLTLLYIVSIKTKFNRFEQLIISLFTVFLAFLGYQFATDFVLVNKYIWSKSEEIAHTQNIDKRQIQGTNAWKLSNRNLTKQYSYHFSYDSPQVNEEYSCCYTVVEEKTISYPLNIFVEPKIYLYKRK